MKKIKFTIENKILHIDYNIENNSIKNMNNTNIISDDDLIFDIRYFKNNMELIAGFLNVIIKNEHIINAEVENEELIITALSFLNLVPNIVNLVIKPDIAINYDIHMAILKNDTLKTINCFTIPTYLLERIDTTKSVKIETRNEVFFISNFLRVNKLDSFSDVFYKRKLTITYEFSDTDWDDFRSFLTINSHLKIIYFEYVSLDLIKKILDYLKEFDRKSIVFNIKGSEENLKHFQSLENFVKKNKFIKKNNIKFRIDYTKEYKMDNFLKLLNFTTLKYIFIAVIISSILGYGINAYDIYQSSKVSTKISDNITELLEEYEDYEQENAEVPEEEQTENPNNGYVSPYYKDYAKVISVLKETNPETVGWLTVNNTTVNYPVVWTSNNSYYLNHDFNRNLNSLGWIFMDYRNNPYELQQNTVIYGHNVSKAKIMFGNLSAALSPNWYTKKSNQIITFNTENADMKWQIFSIYKILATNDYLYSEFDTQEAFLDFANRMKSRSIYDFGVEIHENDKMLTLSTCQNSGKNRLVIHAVLVQ